MKYVALLRGINVGGNSRVEMSRLKIVFENLGFSKVSTYINSGNVIFSNSKQSEKMTASKIEKAIETEFGFKVHVIVRSREYIEQILKELPERWQNDKDMKCDVMFLWEEVHNPEILNELMVKPDIEDVKYVSGAIIWRVDRKNATKSGALKLIGTPLYKKMTIRNCNTVRKLYQMMRAV
jgi:uncharacterized protein (DUF1697 family)